MKAQAIYIDAVGDCRKRSNIFSYVSRTKFYKTLQLRCHHLVYLQLPLFGKLVSQKMPLDGYYYSQSYLLQTLYEYDLVCCAAVFYFQFLCVFITQLQ